MAVRPVVTWGDPRLKMNSSEVGAWSPELEALVTDLFDTTYTEDGVGIAAPQVGINLNLAVVDTTGGADPASRIVLINPEIILAEGSQRGPEGCLSIPGIHEILERPQRVVVRNRTREGDWVELEAEEFLARAFCHEIDHLRGKLFVEYFGPVKRQIIQRKYNKLKQES